jgi:hypothetical protein
MIVSTAVVLGMAWGLAGAENVSWISGESGPKQWSLDPTNPSTSDVIAFSGPTDIYSNSCVAESQLGGTPTLLIDNAAKVVLLWFRPPAPTFCPMIWDPVAGLEGEFGPLAAGDWLFASLSKDIDFEIRFSVVDALAHHVDADAPGPLHNGKSWATAFLTLQDALAVANSGDEIRVAEGIYKPDDGAGVTPGDRDATFQLVDGVIVRGGFAGYGEADPDARDVMLYETILMGDLEGDDLWGILNRDDNSYHVVTGPSDAAGAVLDGFTVTAGHADGPGPRHYGGGLYNPGGNLEVVDCTFKGNAAAFGGGVMNQGAALTMVNTQVVGNRAFVLGGGLYNEEGDAMLHNARIVGNAADYAEIAGGAATYNLNANLTLANSTVADNLSPNGRAIAGFSWDFVAASAIEVSNSILFNGGDEIWSNNPGTVDVRYSTVQGGWAGTGNISANPQFVSPGARSTEGEWIDGDYRLQGTSPAINAGSNAALPADILDLDEDGNVAEPLPVDLDGEPRVEESQVDMGAYEQPGQKPGPGPDVDLVICVGGSCFPLAVDPNASNTFIGSTTLEVETNLQIKLTAQVTPNPLLNGKWTAWLDPDIVGPGEVTTTLWVKAENLDLSGIPAGSTDVEVAAISILWEPAL